MAKQTKQPDSPGVITVINLKNQKIVVNYNDDGEKTLVFPPSEKLKLKDSPELKKALYPFIKNYTLKIK